MKIPCDNAGLGFVGVAVALCWPALAAAGRSSAVAQTLAQAILSEGPEQQRLLSELAESGSKIAHDVLTAWSRDGVYLYDAPGRPQSAGAAGRRAGRQRQARAIRIEDGQFLKDAQGAELRFGASDLNPADMDMRLRGAIQQALDTLALADPEPEARQSAALKLGNSQKPRYIPVLQARLAKETDASVRKALA